jgi:TPR repeat protein
MKVRGNPGDQKTQLLLAKKLVEASIVLVADNNRLDPKMKAKAKEKYVMDAYKIVKKLVSTGYPDAQFYLADCYGEGQLGLEVDAKEAFALYQSAAKAGHAQSAYRVAVCCEIGAEEGGGTKRDPFKAVQWYKRAAAMGDTPAMYKMGMINLKGLLGQARSPREGVSWLKRAAERADEENPHALHELALMYQNASGNDIIVRDEAYASQLFHQAAELGYKFSQFRLGTAYEYGLLGCPVDNRTSIIWYTRAAAQGEHQSELALSGWYLTGSEGILQQNDTEAYLWARKAATAGLAKAEYAMGYFSEVGIGVTANLEDAKRWYWRAAGKSFMFWGSPRTTLLTSLLLLPSARVPQGPGASGRPQKGRQSHAKDAHLSLSRQQAERRRLRGHVIFLSFLLPCSNFSTFSTLLYGTGFCPFADWHACIFLMTPPALDVLFFSCLGVIVALYASASFSWIGLSHLGVWAVQFPHFCFKAFFALLITLLLLEYIGTLFCFLWLLWICFCAYSASSDDVMTGGQG